MTAFTGLFNFLQYLISWYIFIVFLDVILTLLINFGVLNRSNGVVSYIHRATYALTEPALSPIRRRVPMFGNIDISPVILIFILMAISWVVIGNCREPGFISGVLCPAPGTF